MEIIKNRTLCALSIALVALPLTAQNVITTIAGVDAVFTGDGQPAANVPIGYINGVATDGAGNVYFTDPLEHLLLRVTPNRVVSVIAGNGIAGYSGDGGPATSAAIAANDSPEAYAPLVNRVASLGGVAVDQQGDVYFGDGYRVRMVSAQGIITTVAGGGTSQIATPIATQASIGIVTGLAFDASGNLYFSAGNRVHKLTPAGTLSTFAGNGNNGFSGDGGPAIAAQLSQPMGLAFDAQGNLYVADGDSQVVEPHIRRITPTGIISTIAGGGTLNPANGVAPLKLNLPQIGGLAIDSTGAVYAFGPQNALLIKLSGTSANPFSTTTMITTQIAGPLMPGTAATGNYIVGHGLYDNSGIAFDATGNLFVADSRDGYLCKINPQGILSLVAGNGSYGLGGDNGPALGALIQGPTSMTQTPDGTIYFVDSLNARVRAISPAGVITTALSVANFPAIGNLELINSVTSDPAGNVYALLAHRLVELAPNGTVTIIVSQSGLSGDKGDGGPALNAQIQSGASVVRDTAGNLYLSDAISNRIREVTLDGKIHTIAGTGILAVTPDGATAAGSPVAHPTALLLDGLGGLYFQESPVNGIGDDVIRYITPSGILKTIAGNGKGGFTGDGGPATQAGLRMLQRTGLALDKLGNLYVADGFNSRVRVISPSGIINTYAGNGVVATAGDGGPPLQASLVAPQGLLFDAKGDLLISDVSGNRIRSILASPPAITVAPASLTFSGKAAGAVSNPQRLTIVSPIEGVPFSITTSSGADWLVVDTTTGETPQLVRVQADPTNLAQGTYNATVTISSSLTKPTSINVPVTFKVAAADNPQLSVNKTGLSFTFPRNPTNIATRLVQVSNAGSGPLAYSAQAQTANGGNWLSVNPASGSVTPKAPDQLVVTANPNGLTTGTYTGTITIQSSTTGESATVAVNLTVSSLDQFIQLSHGGLSFTSVSGGGIVPPARFAVSNNGRGIMNFTVSASTLSGGPWLSATPSSGTAVAGTSPVINVTANQTGLAPGFYYGQLRIDAPGAANSPHVVTIAMQVLQPGADPGPAIVPSEIVFNTVQGAPPPGSQDLFVYNVSGTPQTYVSSVFSSSGIPILFSPEGATLSLNQPTHIVVQPLTSGLAPGVYESQLTLQFSDGFVRRAGIRTIVRPAPPGSTSSSESRRDAAGCSPSQLILAITSLGQSFAVPAAFPAAVETQVQDDCGNTLDSGNVVASFSNGDPPLSLTSIQGGLWQNTWQAGQLTGPVTVTVTARNPSGSLAGTRQVTGGLGTSSLAPVLSAAVSAASFAPSAPLSPGSIISLFGLNLGNGTASAPSLPLGTSLSSATAIIAGTSMPLIFGSSGQINAVVPSGININTSHQILVQRDNSFSIPILVDVGPANPGVFPYPLPNDPPNQGAVVNAVTYAVAQPGTPVGAGDVVAIFSTGLGAVNQAVPDGTASPSSPLAMTVGTTTVTIGGQRAPVSFSGLSPGFVGLYQIDAVVPAGVTPGDQVPLIVSVAGQTSPAVTIAVK